MSTFSFVISWLSASRIEALLARHRQVEETDLLLGLLAQGGAVAQLLGRQGVSLEAARRSAQEVEDADLRQIGITLVEGVRPRRLEAGAVPCRSPGVHRASRTGAQQRPGPDRPPAQRRRSFSTVAAGARS